MYLYVKVIKIKHVVEEIEELDDGYKLPHVAYSIEEG